MATAIFVTEPNKIMVGTVFEVYRALLGDDKVARVGFNEASYQDFLNDFLAEAVSKGTTYQEEILEAVDRSLALFL